MKRVLVLLLFICALPGCAKPPLDNAIDLREKLLASNGCSFSVRVCADYVDTFYTFDMDCTADSMGSLTFTVTSPESIAGISGTISDDGGRLTFDDQILTFSLLADGQLSPVSAPWVFIKALRSGYIRGSSQTEDITHISIDDSYDDDALQLEIWLNEAMIPSEAEILWQNRKILSLTVTEFTYL